TYRLNVDETAEQVCPDVLCKALPVRNAVSDLTHDGLLVMRNLMDLGKYSWKHHVGFRIGIERGQEFQVFSAAQKFIASLPPSTGLFVHAPRPAAGSIDDRPALSIVVLPTIADIPGVKIPWKVDGRSLRGPPRTDGPRPFMHNDAGLGIQASFPGPIGFARVL